MVTNYFSNKMNSIFQWYEKKRIQYKRNLIYMDNFYKSHDLSKAFLLDITNYSTGTSHSKRCHTLKNISNEKFEKGQTICNYSECNVMVGKWQDKWPVLYNTTQGTSKTDSQQNKK